MQNAVIYVDINILMIFHDENIWWHKCLWLGYVSTTHIEVFYMKQGTGP